MFVVELVPAPLESEQSPDRRWYRVLRTQAIAGGFKLPPFVDEVHLGFKEEHGRWICYGSLLTLSTEITTRRLLDVSVSTLADRVRREFIESWAPTVTASPPRRGSKTPARDFYRQIFALYREAIQRHPRRPIAWMLDEGLPPAARPPSSHRTDQLETIRRWVRKGRAEQPKKGARFLGYYDPIALALGGDPDSEQEET
jgi:hypothetical protein